MSKNESKSGAAEADGIRNLIDELAERMKSLGRVIAAYRSGPEDEHTACFIAISQGQLDELEHVVDRLEAILP